MKWTVELDGQGAYWWKAETIIGPIYASFTDGDFPKTPWKAYWHPYDADKETYFGDGFRTAEEAVAAAEKGLKDWARRESKRLARFAK